MLLLGCFVCDIRTFESIINSIDIHHVIGVDASCCHGILLEHCKELITLKDGCIEKFESAASNKEAQNACFILCNILIIRNNTLVHLILYSP